MNKKIQIMRGLSIIAVIVIHTYNTNTYAWGGYGVIIRPFVNFAVGMFIFLSGYLTKENENGVYRDIIYRRIKKIIIPIINKPKELGKLVEEAIYDRTNNI